jgi:Tfp pilus assembly protein PilN
MLRTNLSTRPFYNERAVHWGLALALVAILALTAFNVTRVIALSQEQSMLASRAEHDESQARALQSEAAKLRSSIDRNALEHVILAAREANQIIDERTFSWTELLNYIERTLPAGVMLTSIAPKVEKGRFQVVMIVNGRSVEAVDDFIEKLEETHAFAGVSPSTETVLEDGLFEVRLVGDYQPTAAAAAPAPAPAGGGGDATGDKPATPEAGKPTSTPARTSTSASKAAPAAPVTATSVVPKRGES